MIGKTLAAYGKGTGTGQENKTALRNEVYLNPGKEGQDYESQGNLGVLCQKRRCVATA